MSHSPAEPESKSSGTGVSPVCFWSATPRLSLQYMGKTPVLLRRDASLAFADVLQQRVSAGFRKTRVVDFAIHFDYLDVAAQARLEVVEQRLVRRRVVERFALRADDADGLARNQHRDGAF